MPTEKDFKYSDLTLWALTQVRSSKILSACWVWNKQKNVQHVYLFICKFIFFTSTDSNFVREKNDSFSKLLE